MSVSLGATTVADSPRRLGEPESASATADGSAGATTSRVVRRLQTPRSVKAVECAFFDQLTKQLHEYASAGSVAEAPTPRRPQSARARVVGGGGTTAIARENTPGYIRHHLSKALPLMAVTAELATYTSPELAADVSPRPPPRPRVHIPTDFWNDDTVYRALERSKLKLLSANWLVKMVESGAWAAGGRRPAALRFLDVETLRRYDENADTSPAGGGANRLPVIAVSRSCATGAVAAASEDDCIPYGGLEGGGALLQRVGRALQQRMPAYRQPHGPSDPRMGAPDFGVFIAPFSLPAGRADAYADGAHFRPAAMRRSASPRGCRLSRAHGAAASHAPTGLPPLTRPRGCRHLCFC